MKNMTIRWLAAACVCALLGGCGEDGETTASTGVDTSTGSSGGISVRSGHLQFSVPSLLVSEAAGTATVNITRTDGSEDAVSVSVASRNGTATQPDDYTAVATTVSFAAGETAKTVTVAIVNDSTDEPNETLYLTLSSPTGGAALGSTREVLITIEDDDISPPAQPRAIMSSVYKQLRLDWTAAAGATSYRLLKDPTGSAGFTQVGSELPAAAHSAAIEVIPHKEDWLNARYAVAACNAAGCTQSSAVSVHGLSIPLIGYLKAVNSAEGVNFGGATALSADGNTLVVGAPGERSAAIGIGGNPVDDCNTPPAANCAYSAGAVYIYSRSGNGWSAPVYIKASNAAAYDYFGKSVSLSTDGNTLVVGAPYKDNYLGAAYVFTRDAGVWTQSAHLQASNPTATSEYFGSSVSVSADGSLVAVGAPNRSMGALAGVGAAFVFARAGNWASAALAHPTPTAYANFGESVAIAAGAAPTLAVGSRFEAVAANASAGAVHLFTSNGAGWAHATRLTSPTPQAYSYFGNALAFSADGTTLAVAASSEDFVSPAGSTLYGTGAAYIFTGSGSSWTAQAHLRASTPASSAEFGGSIALSADGNSFVAGSPSESGSARGVGASFEQGFYGSGAAHVFSRTDNNWSVGTYIKASDTQGGDRFGASVALSGNGDTLAVGAMYEDSAAVNFNGHQGDDCTAAGTQTQCARDSGAIYIY